MHNHSYERIHLRTPSNRLVTDWRIVEQLLPNLPSSFRRSRIVDLRNDPLFQSSCSRTAMSYLFTHLREIESHGTSTALLDSLEDLWKEDRQRHLHGMQGSVRTPQVFAALAQILRPEIFGCCETIFSLMSTFFTRHCEEIMRSKSPQWITYVKALDLMDGGDPMPYLCCLAQHQRDVVPELQRSCGRRTCSNCFSDRTVVCLKFLFNQKKDRNRRKIAEHLGGRRGAGILPKGGRGGHRLAGGLRNATDYPVQDLLEAQDEGRVYVKESDDDDSDSRSDDDDDYDNYHQHHYLDGMYHHHGIPRRIERARYPNFPQNARQGRLMHA